VLKLIRPVLAGSAAAVEVDLHVEKAHSDQVQTLLRKRVWASTCRSYYVDERTGWNYSISPYSSAALWKNTTFPDRKAWIYTVGLFHLGMADRPVNGNSSNSTAETCRRWSPRDWWARLAKACRVPYARAGVRIRAMGRNRQRRRFRYSTELRDAGRVVRQWAAGVHRLQTVKLALRKLFDTFDGNGFGNWWGNNMAGYVGIISWPSTWVRQQVQVSSYDPGVISESWT